MRKLALTITGLLSIVPMFTAIQFEALTGLSSAWDRPENRQLLEERMKLNHTGKRDGKPQFFERSYNANVREIGNFSNAYKCASGKDVTKCRTSAKY